MVLTSWIPKGDGQMTARKPVLQLIREGNPGHHPLARLEGGVRLKPAPLPEPSWSEVFPSTGDDADQQAVVRRLRSTARAEWRLVVRELDPQGLLAAVDAGILKDHATAEAIRTECIRQLAIEGLTVETRSGRHATP
jgi:hypothetical protein